MPSPTESESLSGLAAEIDTLRAELAALRQIVLSGATVDLVDFGELRVFMYKDDASYRALDPKYTNHVPGTPRDLSQPRRSPEERYANPREPLYSFLLSHYWMQGIHFDLFDIGCQYGTSAMATAQVILSAGKNNRVYAFDPGVAGQLAPHNIQLNRLQHLVAFERLAISSDEFPRIVFTELGHSENNRVVNRSAPQESKSFISPCTSIDQYRAARGITSASIVKIDTQGGEVEVFAGMTETLASSQVTVITEFTPEAITTRRDPTAWLRELTQGYTIFEISDNDMFLKPSHQLRQIASNDVAGLVREVMKRSTAYTDLLLIPSGLPGHNALVDHLNRPLR